MKETTVTCPECGTEVQKGRQSYKHAIQEFGLDDRGPAQIIRDMRRHDNPELADRVTFLMNAALDADETADEGSG